MRTMRLFRVLGNTLLWVLAILGLVSGALFVGSRVGVVQPVVVISGSMTPDIQPGDLLITTKSPIEDLQPGAVATIRSAHTGNFVTHRVVAVDAQGDDYAVTMKGDANDVVDAETYLIPAASEVWLPRLTVPAGGLVVESISNPRVTTPALITIAALIVMSFFSPSPPKHRDPRATFKLTRARDRDEARHLAGNDRTDKELVGSSS